MINSYCRMNFLQEAHDLLQDMKRRGIKPNVITYTVLLDGNFKANLRRRVSRHGEGNKTSLKVSSILRDMEQMEINPDVVCYTVLIDGHMKTENIQEAVSLFCKMIDSGLEPDTVTCTALFSGLLRRGHIKKPLYCLMKCIPREWHQMRVSSQL